MPSSIKKLKLRKPFIFIVPLLLLLVALFLFKALYLNTPPYTPREVVNKFIDAIEKQDATLSSELQENYYTKELRKELAEDGDQDVLEPAEGDQSVEVVLTIVDENVQKEIANYTLETKIPLFGTLQIKFKLVKEGDFWKGYEWLVGDIIFPELGSLFDEEGGSENFQEATLGERAGLSQGWYLTVFSTSGYNPTDVWEQPSGGNKLVAIDVQYENSSSSPGNYDSYNFTLKDKAGHAYKETYMGAKQPELGSGTLPPGQKARGFVTFEVPLNAEVTQVNYSSFSGGTAVWEL